MNQLCFFLILQFKGKKEYREKVGEEIFFIIHKIFYFSMTQMQESLFCLKGNRIMISIKNIFHILLNYGYMFKLKVYYFIKYKKIYVANK